jgi:hypothetical protein
VPRSAVAVCLPWDEYLAVGAELAEAGYEAIPVLGADELEALLELRRDLRLAILDGEKDFDGTIEMYARLHEGERNVASLVIVSPKVIERLSLATRARGNCEFVTRPYSASSLRWRVEAMLLRAEIMLIRAEVAGDDSRGPLLDGEAGVASSAEVHRGQIIVVFNPEGGVGKTTITIDTAAMLQSGQDPGVLVIDCDTVTGHTVTSLVCPRCRRSWTAGPGISAPDTTIP